MRHYFAGPWFACASAGTLTWANGNQYSGDWVAGRMTGNALFTYGGQGGAQAGAVAHCPHPCASFSMAHSLVLDAFWISFHDGLKHFKTTISRQPSPPQSPLTPLLLSTPRG